MNKLDTVKNLYKPYRYTIKGNCTIIDSTSGSYVIKNKPKNIDLVGIFNYLKSRNFNYFPDIVIDNRDDTYIYPYLKDDNIINPTKGDDLINLVGLLHAKTSYNKDISEEVHREIYENIKNNINYLKDYYLRYFDLFIKDIYMSPSHYEFIRNYSKINSALDFSMKELDEWYDIVKSKKTERISLIHNNLKLEHLIKSNHNDYLISWDKAKFDTPVLDLVTLYKNNFWELEFNNIYNEYLSINKLSIEEEKLFFILISLVPEIEFLPDEFNTCKNMRKKLDYIFKTEEFLKPYYTTDTDKK